MSGSSDIKRIMEIFNAARGNAAPYREFERAPLRSPDTSFDRETPEGLRNPPAPEAVFDLPSPGPPEPNLFSVGSLRSRNVFRPAEPRAPREGWPALDAALSDLTPAVPAIPAPWPVILFAGMAGGSGRSTLASIVSLTYARQGRPSVLIDLNETNLFQYLLMEFKREEFVRVGRTWTLYTYEPTATSLIVVRPDPFLSGLEEENDRALSRLKDEIVEQASAILPPSGGRPPLLLIDAPPLTRARLSEAALLSSLVVSPIKPDLPSLISIKELEKTFEACEREQGRYCERYYLLNRFISDHPLHQDIYGIFRQILSRRLCPFVIPEDPQVELALAKGASLLDAFSESPAATSLDEAARWIATRLGR